MSNFFCLQFKVFRKLNVSSIIIEKPNLVEVFNDGKQNFSFSFGNVQRPTTNAKDLLCSYIMQRKKLSDCRSNAIVASGQDENRMPFRENISCQVNQLSWLAVKDKARLVKVGEVKAFTLTQLVSVKLLRSQACHYLTLESTQHMNLCISERKSIVEVENESFSFSLNHTYTIPQKTPFVKAKIRLMFCTIL